MFQSQLTLVSGIVCLALGAFLIIRSDIVVSILPIVFGLFVIFDAIGRVQNALDLRRCAIAIGSEGRGLTEQVLAMCDKTVRIPMQAHCESLNAAMAAAVLLWEAYR